MYKSPLTEKIIQAIDMSVVQVKEIQKKFGWEVITPEEYERIKTEEEAMEEAENATTKE